MRQYLNVYKSDHCNFFFDHFNLFSVLENKWQSLDEHLLQFQRKLMMLFPTHTPCVFLLQKGNKFIIFSIFSLRSLISKNVKTSPIGPTAKKRIEGLFSYMYL